MLTRARWSPIADAGTRLTWNGSWTEFVPRFIPRGRQIGQIVRWLIVITAAQAWCPRQFEPALPPPEAGRSRDRRRLLAPYLGLLFASCVSGALLRAVVRSTRHSTRSVLIGRVRGP